MSETSADAVAGGGFDRAGAHFSSWRSPIFLSEDEILIIGCLLFIGLISTFWSVFIGFCLRNLGSAAAKALGSVSSAFLNMRPKSTSDVSEEDKLRQNEFWRLRQQQYGSSANRQASREIRTSTDSFADLLDQIVRLEGNELWRDLVTATDLKRATIALTNSPTIASPEAGPVQSLLRAQALATAYIDENGPLGDGVAAIVRSADVLGRAADEAGYRIDQVILPTRPARNDTVENTDLRNVRSFSALGGAIRRRVKEVGASRSGGIAFDLHHVGYTDATSKIRKTTYILFNPAEWTSRQ